MLLEDLAPVLLDYLYIYDADSEDKRPIFQGYNYQIPEELLKYTLGEIYNDAEYGEEYYDEDGKLRSKIILVEEVYIRKGE